MKGRKMELDELILWHMHNATEAKYDGEKEQEVFHLQAIALLTAIKMEKEGKK